jgi:RHS repeat-associated protein
MDFVRSMLLVLCISVCGANLASAKGSPVGDEAGPARASSVHSAALAVNTSLSPKKLAQSNSSPATFYGAPYYADDSYFGRGPNENSLAAAINDWWVLYQGYWGVNSSNCAYSDVLPGDGATTGTFALMYINGSACGGGPSPVYGSPYAYNPAKNNGSGGNTDGGEGDPSHCSCTQAAGGAPMLGDPINSSTGNKFAQEDDYTANDWLTLRRFYNSSAAIASTSMGTQWRHSFDRSLQILGTPISSIVMFRPDGSQETFTKTNGVWTNDLPYVDSLTEIDNAQGVATSYAVHLGATRHTETFGTTGKLLTVLDANGQGITLTYSDSTTPTNIAPQVGLLLTVTDSWNRALSFNYDSASHLHQVTLPDSNTVTYAYDSTTGNLLSVQYLNGAGTLTRQYVYNEQNLTGNNNLPSALTGIIDETGARYSSTTYDSTGRATSSYFAGNVGNNQVTYNSDGTSTVQFPLGHVATMGFTTVNGLVRSGTVDQPCGPDCGQPWKSRTYDTNGYPATAVDFNGNTTSTTYNPYGLLHIEVDGSGTPYQRTTTTVWNGTFGKPVSQEVQDASNNVTSLKAWSYNYLGEVNASCEMDPAITAAASYACVNTGTVPAGVRRWIHQYCGSVNTTQCPIIGLMVATTGPRTDVTSTWTYVYYMLDGVNHQHGDLESVTDPLGHVTTYLTYDKNGRVLSMQRPDGSYVDMTYTPRGWLNTRTVRVTSDNSAASSDATTTINYTNYGSVSSIVDPDGVTTTFNYDNAHRLTDIYDAQSNHTHYTLDASGNKTKEEVFASGSTTAIHSLSRTYNTLGQLTALIDGLSHTVFNGSYSDSYDGNSNLQHSSDALGYQRQQDFDPLNRLSETVENYSTTNSTTSNAATVYQVDTLDRVAVVSDPTLLNTQYTFDGLNNRTKVQSPDTGISTDTFDAAGDRLTHTDARGIVSTSSYDLINRLSGTTYADTSLNVAYHYDEANSVTGCTSSFPTGRLTSVVESTVTTHYCYDGHGNVIQKQQVTSVATDTTHYTYTLANRLKTVQMPDSTLVTYARDTNGRVSGVQVTPKGNTTAPPSIVSNVTYLPFGPLKSYTLGNGQTVTRSYDASYRLTDVVSPALTLHFALDAMGDITGIGNAPGANPALETYHYDPLYRIKDATEASGTALESYTYDLTGNRLTKVAPGLDTGSYLYTTGTHQLSQVGTFARLNDLNGNTTQSIVGGSTYVFGYNGRNRLNSAQVNGAVVGFYTYNALGQRIAKGASTAQAFTERFAYDENNGLIGEYGTTNRDYIWLGSVPVAVIDNTTNGSVTTSVVNYVHADGLGTPRAVTNSAGTVIWQWAYQGNPFGEQQPTSTAGYVLNLRYPGQYYDVETGLHYNGARYYEPATGRYLQSDPLGLFGGQISTYAYGNNNPLSNIDPLGLCDNEVDRCKKVKQDAIEECSDKELPTEDRTDQSWVYINCVNAYIRDHGCAPGGVPWPQLQPDESPAIPPPDKDAAARAAEAGILLGILGAIAYGLAN